jgi:hypothetical protein
MKNNMNLKSFLCGGLMTLMVGGVFESECARADPEYARADPEYARAGDIAEMIKTSKDRLAGLVNSKKWLSLSDKDKRTAAETVSETILRKVTYYPWERERWEKEHKDEPCYEEVLDTKDGPVTIEDDLRHAMREKKLAWSTISSQEHNSWGKGTLGGPFSEVDAAIIADSCCNGGTYLFHALVGSLLRSKSLRDNAAKNLLKAYEYGLEKYVGNMTDRSPLVRKA